ncbi:hypothetical protein E5082_30040 [Streptomyces griseoluteus]|uniref:Uncharacterized protein n=1 Tax=Streptomyces griseoluteus TaxID=29306 RepID=A0A4Z1CYW7_STRGP|nr:hypothetical protein [Streptomyces griseoluteus]TGN74354.1 hypothetical protein E5082_30040 [Streptomyces griseoluteus]
MHGQDAGDAAARLQSCLVSGGDRVTDAGLQSVDEVADLGVENPGLDDRQRGAGLGRQAGAGRDEWFPAAEAAVISVVEVRP